MPRAKILTGIVLLALLILLVALARRCHSGSRPPLEEGGLQQTSAQVERVPPDLRLRGQGEKPARPDACSWPSAPPSDIGAFFS